LALQQAERLHAPCCGDDGRAFIASVAVNDDRRGVRMSGLREIATGLRFPEGPVALGDGAVLLVEIRRGTLSRVAADGTISVIADCGGGPNGAAIGPDAAIYVCNNGGFEWHEQDGITMPGLQPPDYIGWRIQPAAGAIGPAGASLLHGFDGYQALDSLAVDSEGNVCVVTLRTGAISVLGPEGGLKDVIKPPQHDPYITNICFGGADLRTAYVTSSGRGKLYATQWHCPGLPLNFTA
jgi:gluconolactonase